ncbi:hypothetical protein [Pontibacter populi]|uniref:Glycosyltransferase n=1 Tax=Pontibacter populi TaxID=890055 RepID=A0ABV1RR35_9BACT
MIAALIELGGSHDECLYSQVRFLREKGYRVHMICTANLKQQVSGFDGVDEFLFFDFKGVSKLKSMAYLLQIRKHILKNNIAQVIFNTAEGNLVRNLTLLPFPKRVQFSGIIHNSYKLLKSSSQRIISRKIKKYFVLNDYILKHVHSNSKIAVEAFYPIFFPHFKTIDIPKADGELWVCIPGQIAFKRRDYEGFLNALIQHPPKPGIKYIVLGRENDPDRKFSDMVTAAGLQDHFVLFDKFIPNELFHSYLLQSDIILPLLHPALPKFEQYKKYKITGALNLAFSYRKPLLCKDQFQHVPDLQENALFYDLEHLGETLNRLPELLPTIVPQLYQNPKWEFKMQQQRYINFIEQPLPKL